jgi:hypothetical protein
VSGCANACTCRRFLFAHKLDFLTSLASAVQPCVVQLNGAARVEDAATLLINAWYAVSSLCLTFSDIPATPTSPLSLLIGCNKASHILYDSSIILLWLFFQQTSFTDIACGRQRHSSRSHSACLSSHSLLQRCMVTSI